MPCWIHRGAIADAQNICMGRDTKAIDKVRNQESTGHDNSDRTADRTELGEVQTQAILFLESMSGRVSEIQNGEFLDRLKKDDVIQIQSRSMSDPTLSDIDYENKMA